jgi:hypothetical protein
MKLLLMRTTGTEGFTAGRLFIDGEFECCTIEDEVLAIKIYGRTAIPAGTYQIQITMSPRFKKRMPLLLGVLGFAGVRIHAGNSALDTSGCILVGSRSEDGDGSILEGSRAAMDALQPKIQAALDANKGVWLTIRDDE